VAAALAAAAGSQVGRGRRLDLFDDLGLDGALDHLDDLASQPVEQCPAEDDVHHDDDAEADHVLGRIALLFGVAHSRPSSRLRGGLRKRCVVTVTTLWAVRDGPRREGAHYSVKKCHFIEASP